jgi:WD40-like Beta Propeller Repeat
MRENRHRGLVVLDLLTEAVNPYLPCVAGDWLEGKFSPDGNWVAYESGEPGSRQIYVSSYPAPTTKDRITKTGGIGPRWRGDGRALYFPGAGGHAIYCHCFTDQERPEFRRPAPFISPSHP